MANASKGRKRRNKNICVLESAWDAHTLEPKSSVKSLVEYITNNKETSYSYNFMNTREELVYVLQNISAEDFSFLYMAFHGNPNSIHLGLYSEFKITLDDLAEIMGDKFRGFAIHFGSCAVLNTDYEKIYNFKNRTGAAFVSGYEEYVNFDESSLMDMALINRWTDSRSYGLMFRKMQQSYKSLISANSFKYYI